MLKRILVSIFALFLISTSAFAYSDCESEAVVSLTNYGVLTGDGNGNFRPNDLLTRAEFAAMISRSSGINNVTEFADTSEFNDISSDNWAFDYITFCSDQGYINGDENGNFNPNENISFAQALKICMTAVGYNNFMEDMDETEDNWYVKWIDKAKELNFIDVSKYNPNQLLSREEAAELVYTTINKPLYVNVGFDFSSGEAKPKFILADGSENKYKVEFQTLYTKYIKK